MTWSKGNLEQALNYYYRKLEKSTKENPPPQSQPVQPLFNNNAFSTMRTASIRQKQTETFIKHARKEYELPIRSTIKQTQSQNAEKIDPEIEVDQEFEDADYLPDLFSVCKG